MNKLVLLLLTIILLFTMICCTESESSPVENGETVNYQEELEKLFPLNINDSLTYSVDTLNLVTKNYEHAGTRTVTVDGKTLDGTYYNYIFNESYDLASLIFGSESRSRITENTLEFYADTSGTSQLIPDSLDIEITLTNDEFIKLISYPYNDEAEWQVYNVAVNFGTFVFKVFLVTGKYVGSEELVIPGFDNNIQTEKFKYNIVLKELSSLRDVQC